MPGFIDTVANQPYLSVPANLHSFSKTRRWAASATRMVGQLVLVEAQVIPLLVRALLLDTLLFEFRAIPTCRQDDQVDAQSQFRQW